jgi:hypothetical protein
MALANRVPNYDTLVEQLRCKDEGCLAPKMRLRVDAATASARANGVPVVVFETCRSDQLAKLYFAHGASKSPDALHTWHHYGLAVDVIHPEYGWDLFPGGARYADNPWWWSDLYRVFHAVALDSGSDWEHFKDWPHWQFSGISASPHDAPTILATNGIRAVWQACGGL